MATDRRFGVTGDYAIKMPVKALAAANITLYGAQTIDGVAVTTGDRVLVTGQTSAVDNGIYDVDTGTWTRSADFDGPYDVTKGTLVTVTDGTFYSNTGWRLSSSTPITIGTSALTFQSAVFSDSDQVYFTAAGAGAVPRTSQDKMRERIDGRDFGMSVSASAAANSAYIQAALDATPAGGTLMLPNGEYDFSTGLVRNTPIRIIGDGIYGNGGCYLNYSGNGTAMLFQTSQNGLRLQDFRIVGTAVAAKGIAIQNCFNGILLDHVAVEGFSAGAALYLSDVWGVLALKSQFRQSAIGVQSAIGATYGVVNTVSLIGCEMPDCTSKGVEVMSGVGWVIDGCDFSGLRVGAIGVDLAPGLTAGSNRAIKTVTVRNNYFESSGANVVAVRLGYNATIGVSAIANNTIEGNFLNVSGDHISIDYAEDTAVCKNHHGSLTAGKKKAIVSANALRTVLDIRPRSDINDSGSLSFYMTNDVQTLTEAQGNWTAPNKSGFLARVGTAIANVTGNGTTYSIIFGTEIADRQSEYDNTTGIFTAAKTGLYDFRALISMTQIVGGSRINVILVTSNRNYDLADCGNGVITGGNCTLSGSMLADLDAGDTAKITVMVTGVGADTGDVNAGSHFSGSLFG